MKSNRTKNVKNAESCTSVHGFSSQVSQSIENLISFFAHAAAKWLKGTQNRLEIGSHFPDDREFAPTAARNWPTRLDHPLSWEKSRHHFQSVKGLQMFQTLELEHITSCRHA